MKVDLLCRVLHLEGGIHARTGRRRAASRRLDAVDLLQVAGGALAGGQLEPRDRRRTVGALGGIRRGAGRVELLAGRLAQLQVGPVHVEEGRGGVGEEVLARDGEVAGPQPRLLGRQVKLQRQTGDHVGQVRVGRDDAAGVEQGRHGADLYGSSGGVGCVACVVLGTAADGNVLQCQACAHCWQRCRSCRELLDS